VLPEAKPNPLVVADPPETHTLTHATTKQALHIVKRHPAVCIHTDHVHPILVDYFLVISSRAMCSSPTNHGNGHIGINIVKD
jgi:hypothetical protein